MQISCSSSLAEDSELPRPLPHTVAGGIQVGNATKVTVSDNIVRANESDGIRLYESHDEVIIMNNTIYEPTGAERFECIKNDSTTPAAIVMSDNTCN